MWVREGKTCLHWNRILLRQLCYLINSSLLAWLKDYIDVQSKKLTVHQCCKACFGQYIFVGLFSTALSFDALQIIKQSFLALCLCLISSLFYLWWLATWLLQTCSQIKIKIEMGPVYCVIVLNYPSNAPVSNVKNDNIFSVLYFTWVMFNSSLLILPESCSTRPFACSTRPFSPSAPPLPFASPNSCFYKQFLSIAFK